MTTSWKRLLPHVVTVACGEVATRFVGGLAAIVLARRLGGHAFGVLEFALGLVAYFQIAASIGLEAVGTRAIAQGRLPRQVVAEVALLRFALAALSVVVLFVIAPWLPDPRATMVAIRLGVILLPVALSLRWALLAEERSRAVAIIGTLAQVVYLGSVLVAVRGPGDLARVPWLLALVEVAASASLAAAWWRRHGTVGVSVGTGPRRLLAQALPIGLTRALGQMLYNADVILLGLLGYLSEVGYYGAAYRILTVLLVLPTAYFTAVFPALVRDESAGRDPDVARRSAAWLLGFGVPVALLVADAAPAIVGLVYGSGYEPAVAPLRILILALPVIALRSLFRNLLLASHRELANLRQMAAAALFNVALNLVLIVPYGVLGAAAATLAAEGLLLVLAARETRRALGTLGVLGASRAPLCGGAAMTVTLLAGSGLSLAPRLVLATFAFAAGFLAGRERPFPGAAS